jgi:hypothetical protein
VITPSASAPEPPGQMPASGFSIQAPYEAGTPGPIEAHGNADAGGRDDVAGTVAGAQASAEARYHEHMSDATGTGPGVIGDLMQLPGSGLDPGVGSLGIADPSGGFYDPPRNYGDTP